MTTQIENRNPLVQALSRLGTREEQARKTGFSLSYINYLHQTNKMPRVLTQLERVGVICFASESTTPAAANAN